jgi:hypothetical protein
VRTLWVIVGIRRRRSEKPLCACSQPVQDDQVPLASDNIQRGRQRARIRPGYRFSIGHHDLGFLTARQCLKGAFLSYGISRQQNKAACQ